MTGGSFFDGVEQLELAIDGHDVVLPIFYREASAMSAIFPARYGRLVEVLPDPRFRPVRVAPGVGLLMITAFDYRDSDLGPYREVGVAILLAGPPEGSSLPSLEEVTPALPMIAQVRRRQLYGFVWHLPVTTEIALAAGRTFWNYPKFVTSIDFADTPAGGRECQVGAGPDYILTLRAGAVRATREENVQLFTHVWQNRQPQAGEVKAHAQQLGMSLRPAACTIELAKGHPIAEEISRVLLSRRSLAYFNVPMLETILYGPQILSVTLANTIREAAEARNRVTA
jgi:hypothetical protein